MRGGPRTAKQRLKIDLKTIAIVVSATLAALFVHHLIERPKASAGEIGVVEAVRIIVDGLETSTFQ